MPRFLKFILYPLVFAVSFAFFLYWTFPYGVLRDRATAAIEGRLGSGIEVEIKELKPYWFTGAEIQGLSIREAGGDAPAVLLTCRRLFVRAPILSLLAGRPRVVFDVEFSKGEISGQVGQADDVLAIDAELDDVDLGQIKAIGVASGLNLTSRIDGGLSLRIDQSRPIRSTGRVALELLDVTIAPSQAKISGLAMELPQLVVARGRESLIKLEIGKGAVQVEQFRFTGGDVGLDLKGKVFLSSKVENCRFNLSGSFTASKAFEEAVPFLFMIEQQKQEDGSFPLTLTGRLGQPTIKIGSFTVPM